MDEDVSPIKDQVIFQLVMLVFGELAGLGILRPCIDSIQGVFELPLQKTKNIKNTNLW